MGVLAWDTKNKYFKYKIRTLQKIANVLLITEIIARILPTKNKNNKSHVLTLSVAASKNPRKVQGGVESTPP